MRRLRFVLIACIGGGAIVGCDLVLGLQTYRPCDGGECASDAASDAQDEPDASTCSRPYQVTCTTFPQSGCEAGENCETTSDQGATSCATAGTTPLQNNCVSYSSCAKGSQCIGGVCKEFCCTANDCGGRHCVNAVNSSNKPIVGLSVCAAGCDPMNPGAVCGPSVTCLPYPWDGAGKDDGDCYGPAGTGVGDGGCNGTPSGQLQCAPGYYCLKTGTCAKWCRVGHDSDCGDAGTCTFFNTNQPVINGVAYGVCY